MIIFYTDDINEYIKKNENYIFDYASDLRINIDNDEKLFAFVNDLIDSDADNLKDLIKQYDYKNDNKKIIVVASLGLWYGRRDGCKVFDNLSGALFSLFENVNMIYFKNKNATLTLEASHHDGNNIFKFYTLKNGKKRAIKYNDLIALL